MTFIEHGRRFSAFNYPHLCSGAILARFWITFRVGRQRNFNIDRPEKGHFYWSFRKCMKMEMELWVIERVQRRGLGKVLASPK